MANFNFNRAELGGRLTGDPELKMTPMGKKVCVFTVAVNSSFKTTEGASKAYFINCVAWEQQAEFVTKYFRKGSCIFIEGEMQSRSWTDKEGVSRYTVEVRVNEVHFVDSRKEMEAYLIKQTNPQNETTYDEDVSPYVE